MGFTDFFKPKWRHSDWKIRCGAVDKIDDDGILMQMAETDAQEEVRQAALTSLVKRMSQLHQDVRRELEGILKDQDSRSLEGRISIEKTRHETIYDLSLQSLDHYFGNKMCDGVRETLQNRLSRIQEIITFVQTMRPPLAFRLTDALAWEDPYLQFLVCRIAAKIPSDEVHQPLMELVKKFAVLTGYAISLPQIRVMREAVKILRDHRVVPPRSLVRFLLSNSDGFFVKELSGWIAEYPASVAASDIVEIHVDAGPRQGRELAVELAVQCRLEEAVLQLLSLLLQELGTGDQPREQQQKCLEAIWKIGSAYPGSVVASDIIEILAGAGSWQGRELAVEWAVEYDLEEAVPHLVTILLSQSSGWTSEPSGAQKKCVEAIKKIGSVRAIPLLIEEINREENMNRYFAAVYALGQFRSAEAVEPLMKKVATLLVREPFYDEWRLTQIDILFRALGGIGDTGYLRQVLDHFEALYKWRGLPPYVSGSFSGDMAKVADWLDGTVRGLACCGGPTSARLLKKLDHFLDRQPQSFSNINKLKRTVKDALSRLTGNDT